MTTTSAQISVDAGQHYACIKIQGRANFNCSPDFNTALTHLRDRGISFFVIELSGCALMDSTFLGVLAGFGLQMSEDDGHPQKGRVELRNANARVAELLENIGVLHLFSCTQGELESPEALEACAIECPNTTKEETTRMCLEAHQTLMAINPENVARFKDVTQFLAEDLARLRKAS